MDYSHLVPSLAAVAILYVYFFALGHDQLFWYIGGLTTLSFLLRVTRFSYLYFLRPSLLVPRYLRSSKSDSGRNWALVTGASDGLGLSLAQELVNRGFNVVLHGRNPSKLSRVQDKLSKDFPNNQFKTLILDASEPFSNTQVSKALSVVSTLPLTILVNNVGGTAGVMQRKYPSLAEHNPSQISALFNVNAAFPTNLTRTLLPVLERNSPALVLNIGSLGDIGIPYTGVYTATKAYFRTWSATLRQELGMSGDLKVEVLTIGVGSVAGAGDYSVKASWFAPSSVSVAKASLDRVGCGLGFVIGHISHALQAVAADFAPAWMVEESLLKLMKGKRDSEDEDLRKGN